MRINTNVFYNVSLRAKRSLPAGKAGNPGNDCFVLRQAQDSSRATCGERSRTKSRDFVAVAPRNDTALRIIAFFVFLLGFIFLQMPAEAGTVRINPTKIRLVIPATESRSGVIEVENATEDPLIIKAYVQDWSYVFLQNGTKEFFPAATTKFSCSNWISFSPSDFTIPSFGKQSLSYTVKVPEKAEGGYYAVLFFETLMQKPDLNDSSSVGVVVRIGALFYIEPQGTIQRDARVDGLRVEKPSKESPLTVSLDLKNTGNVDLKASGTFHVMDQEGMIFARGELSDSYTFPGDGSKVVGEWKEALLPGKYDLVFTIDIGKASEEAGLERGPVITKDAVLEIGEDGGIAKVGELK